MCAPDIYAAGQPGNIPLVSLLQKIHAGLEDWSRPEIFVPDLIIHDRQSMIKADTHSHTLFSHGAATPAEMLAAAREKGLSILGFSEHSPRPLGFDYTHEYREKLARHFPDYVEQVLELKKVAASEKEDCRPLLGMEMDWLAGQEEFIRSACNAYDFDFLIGSVHFVDAWGFDDGDAIWKTLSQEECEKLYERYFQIWKDMLSSGLFQIAAHPDLIKIFSPDQFHIWLDKPESKALILDCLETLRDAGMTMEISSAGLRKACREIYPCPAIMSLAASANVPVSLASDAHCPGDVAYAFPRLVTYARTFGFDRQTVFDHGARISLPF